MSRVIENVVCLECGCQCDDARLTVDAQRIVQAEQICEAGRAWFLAQNAHPLAPATIGGRNVAREAALHEAARRLKSARAPLVFGLSRCGTAAQQAAVALADRLKGTLDPSASAGEAAAALALAHVGASTCTWGEVRHRANLILFWGADPAATNPEHLERHSVYPKGEWIAGGRADRQVLVIDSAPNQTASIADRAWQIPPGSDAELISALRAMLRGRPAPSAGAAGLSPETLVDLLARLKGCRTGAAFYGPRLVTQALAAQTLAAFHRLVQELNAHARFYASTLGSPGNGTGAGNVLAWQTGYSRAVNFARGYPRYSPHEYSATALLERGEVDACLVVSAADVAGLSSAARARLANIPVVTLLTGDAAPPAPGADEIRLGVAADGVHVPCTAYRADGVALPVQAVLPSELPSVAQTLAELEALVR